MRRCWLCLHIVSVISTAFGELSWEQRVGYNGEGRHHPITFANETHGFVLSGTTSSSFVTNDFYMYDEAADEWADLSVSENSMFPGEARSFGYGVVLNSMNHPKAYLGFGVATSGVLNDWWEFDMSNHAWRALKALPGPGRRHPAVVPVFTPKGWEIHVGLGDGYTGNFNDWYSYDVNSDTWTQLPDFPGSKRHHPFYFGLGGTSYVGLGHSNIIERDFYSYNDGWGQESDFASYDVGTIAAKEKSIFNSEELVTTEARVAGTQFSIDLPPVGSNASRSSLAGSLGFVLSGDGDDHRSMEEGEFHAFYPGEVDNGSWWRRLPPHPGRSRWAPGSFVIRGSSRAYLTSGYDRVERLLYADLWRIDLASLLSSGTSISPSPTRTKQPTIARETPNPTPSNLNSSDFTSGSNANTGFAIIGALLSLNIICLWF